MLEKQTIRLRGHHYLTIGDLLARFKDEEPAVRVRVMFLQIHRRVWRKLKSWVNRQEFRDEKSFDVLWTLET